MMITLRMLRGACPRQKAIFKREWPDGAEATIENVRRAQELGLDLAWGTKWFTLEALRLYNKTTDEAWRLFNEAQTEAWRLFNEAQTEPQRILNEASAEARLLYDETVAEAWLAAFLASVEVPA